MPVSKFATQDDRILVATYGTLITGQGNHHCMIAAEGVSLGLGKTVENCDMFGRTSGFPMLSLTKQDHGIPAVVEVFETHERGLLGPLDCLEGYPRFYDRSIIEVELDSGEKVKAWIYHIEDRASYGAPIMNGDWVNRRDDSAIAQEV